MTTFQGFSPEAITFFAEIRDNNNREWFEQHKPRFVELVQQPAQAFVLALGDRLKTIAPHIQYDTKLSGSGSIMRIYRDTRFSKDKTPYKTNLAMVWWEGAGKKTEEPCFYFQFDADSAWLAGGLYMMPKELLDPYRAAVADDTLGPALETAIAAVQAAGVPVEGDSYKQVPRGYDKQHPRAALLKCKGLVARPSVIPWDVVIAPSGELVDVCFEYCQAILPLQQWFAQMSRSVEA